MAARLARRWERIRRIRKRIAKGGPWVVFPRVAEDKKDSHPMSTSALALNVEAVMAIIECYGPNPVHILPLQKQVG